MSRFPHILGNLLFKQCLRILWIPQTINYCTMRYKILRENEIQETSVNIIHLSQIEIIQRYIKPFENSYFRTGRFAFSRTRHLT